MKNLHYIVAILILMFSTAVIAHHPAEGIVDEDVYAMIDALVVDTPHATLDLTTMDPTITTQTIVSLDKMLDDGLLDYIGMLDGDVTVIIEFNDDRSVTMTIIQVL